MYGGSTLVCGSENLAEKQKSKPWNESFKVNRRHNLKDQVIKEPAPAALHPGKEALVFAGNEAGWVPEPVMSTGLQSSIYDKEI
jgi:hypothetical protein